ncbi:hypothetical protein D3C78_1611200 [compost metagenome]
MVGTPVVCSDACGVAGVVRKTGHGGVFRAKDMNELTNLLAEQISKGPLESALRKKIADWSSCLNADSGAAYLHEILMFSQNGDGSRPTEPWEKV